MYCNMSFFRFTNRRFPEMPHRKPPCYLAQIRPFPCPTPIPFPNPSRTQIKNWICPNLKMTTRSGTAIVNHHVQETKDLRASANEYSGVLRRSVYDTRHFPELSFSNAPVNQVAARPTLMFALQHHQTNIISVRAGSSASRKV